MISILIQVMLNLVLLLLIFLTTGYRGYTDLSRTGVPIANVDELLESQQKEWEDMQRREQRSVDNRPINDIVKELQEQQEALFQQDLARRRAKKLAEEAMKKKQNQ